MCSRFFFSSLLDLLPKCELNKFCRYPSYGRRMIEDDIEWNRLRAPTVDTLPYVLHVSDCLDDLQPDDHIEIQWRKSKEFAYGLCFCPKAICFSSY